MAVLTSVVIPAHNEERTLGRLLSALTSDLNELELDIVVVCNGCTDGTARVAREFGDRVRVVELERPSKVNALEEGDRVSSGFPRFYVDADVEIDVSSIARLAAALHEPGTLVVAPEREFVLEHSNRVVRSYYRVWGRLPAVREGLFGRGVLGVGASGYRRITPRPDVLGDDLYVHSSFAIAERRVVSSARARIWAPRRAADLVRRRTRAVEGNAELEARAGAPSTSSDSGLAVLRILSRDPVSTVDVVVFLVITLTARVNSQVRRWLGAREDWLRDESSREGPQLASRRRPTALSRSAARARTRRDGGCTRASSEQP